ncbi:hypothetical protein FG476_09250 [Xylella fastidiosa subsp. multiplex]|uniref:Uncharacterized protein n=1 Tax=Xylella fastidiosa subsp. multiplex TaxID=644357 RepID=A0A9Q4MK05_XYLFS|nr:hypothetical protein [Xylella fastidiosa]ERI60920.1 hypothetical protein M233_01445 [Xylella fastidiosa subsp. multiplex Griffin-1]MDC6418067.1 hypothetical protein [Xylella fastidiosa subsp. multiplex]MDS9989948.1 hypothetical protein [Xylella fastidiosa]MRT34740.1 hypothetical protein [Xylella fastidiosa subsp. multiplex]MRT46398.1 hypothetical protein [Xylella fastidiosa subsp. multiplex]
MLGVRVVVVVPYRLRNGLCYPCFTILLYPKSLKCQPMLGHGSTMCVSSKMMRCSECALLMLLTVIRTCTLSDSV